MITSERFYFLWSKPDFRDLIVESFEERRSFLENSFPNRRGDRREKFESARITSADQISRRNIYIHIGISRVTYNNFISKDSRISFDTFKKICSCFEPIVSANEIIFSSVRRVESRDCGSVEAEFEDRSVHNLLALEENESLYPVGAVVEVRRFGDDVGNGGDPGTIGISPKDVAISYSGISFSKTPPEIVNADEYRFMLESRTHSEDKLSLVDIIPRFDMVDEGKSVRLLTEKTDFITIKSVMKNICNIEYPNGSVEVDNSIFRSRFGSPEPYRNLVPNSLCMHYIVRFSDYNFLAIRRHEGVAYERSRVSISGEEQIKLDDLNNVGRYSAAERWLIRSMMEEVFPRRNFQIESSEGREIADLISSSRILSLIYEERYCNFSVVSFIQLKCTVSEYIEYYRLALKKSGRADFEGNRYWFPDTEVARYFREGSISLMPFSKSAKRIGVTSVASECDDSKFRLHSSSLYRLHSIRRLMGL